MDLISQLTAKKGRRRREAGLAAELISTHYAFWLFLHLPSSASVCIEQAELFSHGSRNGHLRLKTFPWSNKTEIFQPQFIKDQH